ncbi:hypothetical protein SpCBS45565_g01513 [Spizellomyces sp. 'palustris']|nr:hypothetical protein SpCBS45565_g01513 [Spizellomyces sp. 'palustris']
MQPPQISLSWPGCSHDVLTSIVNAKLDDIEETDVTSPVDEAHFLEAHRPPANTETPELTVQFAERGVGIARLEVHSNARILEIYTDEEYCGSFEGSSISERITLEQPVPACTLRIKFCSLPRDSKDLLWIRKITVYCVLCPPTQPSLGDTQMSFDMLQVRQMVDSMNLSIPPSAQSLLQFLELSQISNRQVLDPQNLSLPRSPHFASHHRSLNGNLSVSSLADSLARIQFQTLRPTPLPQSAGTSSLQSNRTVPSTDYPPESRTLLDPASVDPYTRIMQQIDAKFEIMTRHVDARFDALENHFTQLIQILSNENA